MKREAHSRGAVEKSAVDLSDTSTGGGESIAEREAGGVGDGGSGSLGDRDGGSDRCGGLSGDRSDRGDGGSGSRGDRGGRDGGHGSDGGRRDNGQGLSADGLERGIQVSRVSIKSKSSAMTRLSTCQRSLSTIDKKRQTGSTHPSPPQICDASPCKIEIAVSATDFQMVSLEKAEQNAPHSSCRACSWCWRAIRRSGGSLRKSLCKRR